MDYKNEAIFRIYSFKLEEIQRFLDEITNIGFTKSSVVSDQEYTVDIDKEIKRGITEGVIVNLNPDSHINILHVHPQKDLFSLSFYFQWTVDIELFIVRFMAESAGLIYGYLTNYYDIKWQNETSIQAYKANNKDYHGLNLGYDIFDQRCIDVSKNYGREIRHGDFLIVAAYCSWFSIPHWENLGLHGSLPEKVLASEKMYNGLIQVKLFDRISPDYSKERTTQEKFLSTLRVL